MSELNYTDINNENINNKKKTFGLNQGKQFNILKKKKIKHHKRNKKNMKNKSFYNELNVVDYIYVNKSLYNHKFMLILGAIIVGVIIYLKIRSKK